MVGMLDELMLRFQQQQGGGFSPVSQPGFLERLFGGGQPSAPPNEQELAAAMAPMIGQAPGMGPIGGMAKPDPFGRGAAPMMAPGVGMMGDVKPPMPAVGPPAMTSLDGGPIPLPKRDPRGTDMSSRNISTQVPGAPMSLAPSMPMQMDAPAPSAMQPRGRSPSAAMLMAMGAGFAGKPSFGRAMSAGFGNAAAVSAQDQKRNDLLDMQGQSQADIYRALKAKGVPEAEIMAGLRSPSILKELAEKYLGKGKEPPSGYTWRDPTDPRKGADFIVGGPEDPATKRASGDRQNAPTGYYWNDPSDPRKGVTAIPEGPATKVDAQVAARIGMSNSFLGQLPAIRADLQKGEATGLWDATKAMAGVGRAGEIKRQIESGAEALLRNLTGAGMNMDEARRYSSRYHLQPHDRVESIMSKMNQLERELRFVNESVSKGRGGTPTVVNGKLMIGDAEVPSSTSAMRKGTTKSGLTYEIED